MKKTFSPSWLKTAEQCMYKAVHEVKNNDAAPLVFGNMLHDISERVHIEKLAPAKAQAQFIYNLTEELRLNTMDYLSRGQKAVGHLFDKKFSIKGELFDVESRNAPEAFRVDLGRYNSRLLSVPVISGGRKLWGKIDRIDRETLDKGRVWHIIDYKTGRTKNDMFQVLCYAIMIIRAYGIDTDKDKIIGHYFYLESGEKVSNEIDVRDVIEHLKKINFIVSQYDTGIYQRSSGGHCRFCTIEGCPSRRYKHYTKR